MTFTFGSALLEGRLLPLMNKLSVQPLLYGGVEVRNTSMGSIVVFFTRPEVK